MLSNSERFKWQLLVNFPITAMKSALIPLCEGRDLMKEPKEMAERWFALLLEALTCGTGLPSEVGWSPAAARKALASPNRALNAASDSFQIQSVIRVCDLQTQRQRVPLSPGGQKMVLILTQEHYIMKKSAQRAEQLSEQGERAASVSRILRARNTALLCERQQEEKPKLLHKSLRSGDVWSLTCLVFQSRAF